MCSTTAARSATDSPATRAVPLVGFVNVAGCETSSCPRRSGREAEDAPRGTVRSTDSNAETPP